MSNDSAVLRPWSRSQAIAIDASSSPIQAETPAPAEHRRSLSGSLGLFLGLDVGQLQLLAKQGGHLAGQLAESSVSGGVRAQRLRRRVEVIAADRSSVGTADGHGAASTHVGGSVDSAANPVDVIGDAGDGGAGGSAWLPREGLTDSLRAARPDRVIRPTTNPAPPARRSKRPSLRALICSAKVRKGHRRAVALLRSPTTQFVLGLAEQLTELVAGVRGDRLRLVRGLRTHLACCVSRAAGRR